MVISHASGAHDGKQFLLFKKIAGRRRTILMGSDITELYKEPISRDNFSLYINTDNKMEAD